MDVRTDHRQEPAPLTPQDSTVEGKLAQIGGLLEEMVDDNTAVVAALNRLNTAQEGLVDDVAREISMLRGELAGALTYRTLKDLCAELVGPLAAIEQMLAKADFTDPETTAGHVRSLSVALYAVLDRMGAHRIAVDPGRQPFDPYLHRCVGVLVPAESPYPDTAPGTVVRVLEDGYVLGDRLLVPAMVEIQAGHQATRATEE